MLETLDRNPDKGLSQVHAALPTTFGSPTVSPHCADEEEYGVVESPVSRARLDEMVRAVDGVLRENSQVGASNQTIRETIRAGLLTQDLRQAGSSYPLTSS
ncbi:hypothetical protein F1D61_15250 [Methylobacterium aquaticum]|nr:hypothetical protein F1D61_15250 [Methylobacterium aquaticum]